jgi:hypothetical protein
MRGLMINPKHKRVYKLYDFDELINIPKFTDK